MSITSREKLSYACVESNSNAIKFFFFFKVTNYCKWHKIFIISNNGLLIRAITDILFYTDLIGTMIEIN